MWDFFSSENLKPWAERLLVVLLLDYIVLFGAETVLPGFVMGVFNLNYVLLAVLGLAGYLTMAGKREVGIEKDKISVSMVEQNKANYAIIFSAMAFVSVIAVFALYKAMAWQMVVYIIAAIASGVVLYKNLLAR